MVGYEREIREGDPRNRAGGIPGGHPGFYAGTVVRLTGTNGDRVTHELQRNGAPEMVGDMHADIQWLQTGWHSDMRGIPIPIPNQRALQILFQNVGGVMGLYTK